MYWLPVNERKFYSVIYPEKFTENLAFPLPITYFWTVVLLFITNIIILGCIFLIKNPDLYISIKYNKNLYNINNTLLFH